MELRGYDSYDVTLGDELRGDRASRGQSVRDAARALCLRPALIEAIENGDLSAFPNRSVVPGYVRSYARYLGRDPEAMYHRFCAETGFQSTLSSFGMSPTTPRGGAGSRSAGLAGPVGADLAASRFAVRPAPRRVGSAVPLGALVSGAALVGLTAAVGYGGWTLLEDVQRLGFAPLPNAPVVVADAPVIAAPALGGAARVTAKAYEEGGALLGRGAPAPLPLAARDGPIVAIDPEGAGLVPAGPPLAERPTARRATAGAPTATAAPAPTGAVAGVSDRTIAEVTTGTVAGAPTGTVAGATTGTVAPAPNVRASARAVGQGSADANAEASAEASDARAGLTALAMVSATTAVPEPAAPPAVAVVATVPAWMRIRDAEGAVLYVGTMQPGGRFELPARARSARLRAGNAHGVFVEVDGVRHGPLGASGAVVKHVSLDAASVAATYAAAPAGDAGGGEAAIRAASAD
ncbi:MAG: RodZ domain-containing protein [Paracoccaceae bacterium]